MYVCMYSRRILKYTFLLKKEFKVLMSWAMRPNDSCTKKTP